MQNEGQTSAFLILPPGGIAVSLDGKRPSDEGIEILRWTNGEQFEYRLAPGQTQWFLLESGHTVAEWAQLWRRFDGDISRADSEVNSEEMPGVRFVIEIRDQFVSTFRDTLTIDVLALPLQPVPGSASSWQVPAFAGDPYKIVIETRVREIERTYGPFH